MSDCRKCADFEWCMENEKCGLFKSRTMTNADRIRAMSDEKLAEWFWKNDWTYLKTKWEMLDWLKEEAKEDE